MYLSEFERRESRAHDNFQHYSRMSQDRAHESSVPKLPTARAGIAPIASGNSRGNGNPRLLCAPHGSRRYGSGEAQRLSTPRRLPGPVQVYTCICRRSKVRRTSMERTTKLNEKDSSSE